MPPPRRQEYSVRECRSSVDRCSRPGDLGGHLRRGVERTRSRATSPQSPTAGRAAHLQAAHGLACVHEGTQRAGGRKREPRGWRTGQSPAKWWV